VVGREVEFVDIENIEFEAPSTGASEITATGIDRDAFDRLVRARSYEITITGVFSCSEHHLVVEGTHGDGSHYGHCSRCLVSFVLEFGP
jgi:hypothetical protein